MLAKARDAAQSLAVVPIQEHRHEAPFLAEVMGRRTPPLRGPDCSSPCEAQASLAFDPIRLRGEHRHARSLLSAQSARFRVGSPIPPWARRADHPGIPARHAECLRRRPGAGPAGAAVGRGAGRASARVDPQRAPLLAARRPAVPRHVRLPRVRPPRRDPPALVHAAGHRRARRPHGCGTCSGRSPTRSEAATATSTG